MTDKTRTALGIFPLARELGEKLGGEPWARDIPKLEPITTQVMLPDPRLYRDLEGE